MTPLALACEGGHVEIVKILLDYFDIDVNLKNKVDRILF